MRAPSLLVLCAVPLAATPLPAQSLDPHLLSALVWRNVGPFRGGRISAVSGAIGQPRVFYAGTPAGGVWKTTSAGETWFPVFDSIRTVSSIGAIEVAPSDPNVIYVGTGDHDSFFDGMGDGMYKSSDAGRTWRHSGLEGTEQIPAILVNPHDPNIVLVAALGQFRAQSDARGVFRSTDGGATWTRTLYVDDQTGVATLAQAADAPDVLFAAAPFHYIAPGASLPVPDTARMRTRLYKSSDGGLTWHEILGGGLAPLDGQTSIAVAIGTNAQRVYLIGDFGLYRSDDGGTSWRHMAADDKRIANGQGGYNCGVYVDSKNPDIVYTFNVTAYKSTDGGNSFTGFKGGPPGGDDPQVMWIDPTNGKRMLMGYDQGAIVSFDGGDTWSSWYNQSTEQVYHIAADNSLPYWIYATQQDAGAIATRSRGNLGAVTTLDWKPVPGWEWGTSLPRCACIWSIAASTVRPGVIWIGVINGIVQVSRNHGVTWNDVTIPDIGVGVRVTPTWVEASPFDAGTAYIAFNLEYRGDVAPHLYRTRDYGKTWRKIVVGLPATSPSGAAVRVVRADPKRRGLLFAGTESAVYVSFDDGDHWQSLMLNLPTTMVDDIAIHDNDLIVGTYGRGIWVLDDFAVLRQLRAAVASDPAHLFKPSEAIRVRRNVDYNTPFPKEEPQAPNPAPGAIIYYLLGSKPSEDIGIDVLDAHGNLVRHLTSAPSTPVREAARAPMEQF